MNYNEFKTAVIDAARAKKIEDYELYYTRSEDSSVSVFKTEVKEYSTNSSMGVCFRCIVNGKLGYASTENLTAEEAVSMVERAMENASSIESEEPVFIHGTGDIYDTYEKKAVTNPSGEDLIGFTMDLQKAVYAEDSRVEDGTESAAGFMRMENALYNSKGLDLSDSASFAYGYAMPIVKEGEDMYDGMEIATGDFASFDADRLAGEAVKDAVSTIGYTSVDSGKYNVLFSNKVMSSLLAAYSGIFYAENAQKGLSLLNGKEGEKIAADQVTLTDDPMYENALVKRTFDAEGVAAHKKNVIENGKMVTLLYNLKSAAAAGVKTTGNAMKASYASPVGTGTYSFYINPVEGTTEELIEKTGSGIYLTGVEGLHAGANPVTGDFSLSSEGFKIENGKKAGPIKNFTVSGNFYELLKNITAVGADLMFHKTALGVSRPGSPSVLVPGITVAGK